MPKPEVGAEYIHIRVRDPGLFQKDSFVVKWLSESEGIKGTFGRLKNQTKLTLQKYMFLKTKWTMQRAKAWVSKHKTKSKQERERAMFIELATKELVDNKKYPVFRKHILSPGIYPTILGDEVEITSEDIPYLAKSGGERLAEGFKIHTPLTHSDNPMDNAGFVKGFVIEGDELLADIAVLDPDVAEKIRLGTIADVSPKIDLIKDDEGHWRPEEIDHIALTMVPVLPGQRPFVELSRKKEKEMPEPKEFKDLEEANKAYAELSVKLGEGVTNKAELEKKVDGLVGDKAKTELKLVEVEKTIETIKKEHKLQMEDKDKEYDGETITRELKSMKLELAKSKDENLKLSTDFLAYKAAGVLNKYILCGKVKPADAKLMISLYLERPEEMVKYMEALPVDPKFAEKKLEEKDGVGEPTLSPETIAQLERQAGGDEKVLELAKTAAIETLKKMQEGN